MYKIIQRFVESKARQYEHNVEEIQRAQEQAEHDYTHFDEIAPGTQQTELEDMERGTTDSLLYIQHLLLRTNIMVVLWFSSSEVHV
jgi:hypothetical protein